MKATNEIACSAGDV